MGVLTDFVVADTTDAERVGKSEYPAQEFGGLDAKGIDTVKLGTLYAILLGRSFNPGFMGDSMIYSESKKGPWVMVVPPDLVDRLANLPASKVASVVEEWAGTEEFSPEYDNWPEEAVKQVLENLVALCRRARAEEKSLLMWMCL